MKPSNNVIAQYLSGVEPPSKRRRFRHRLRFWAPFPCYGASWLVMFGLLDGVGREQWFIATVLALVVVGIGVILFRIGLNDSAYRLQRNWHDYRLAGISGRDILWAFAYSRVKSGAWLSAATFALALLLSIPHFYDWIDDGPYWALLAVVVDVAFLLTGGILLDTAMWTRAGGRGQRILAAGFLLLCSQATIFMLVILSMWVMGLPEPLGEELFFILVPITIVTLGVRIWCVKRAWRRAIQRLDGQIDF